MSFIISLVKVVRHACMFSVHCVLENSFHLSIFAFWKDLFRLEIGESLRKHCNSPCFVISRVPDKLGFEDNCAITFLISHQKK